MKRFHVHVGVENLDRSTAFYSGLFGESPSISKLGYAKWMLDDPRVNFSISEKGGARHGIEHLGVQVENREELAEVYGRLQAANGPVMEEGATTCCYAKSEKSWIADPDGVMWEAFLTTGEATVYGADPELQHLVSSNAAANACCTPELAAEPAPAATCC